MADKINLDDLSGFTRMELEALLRQAVTEVHRLRGSPQTALALNDPQRLAIQKKALDKVTKEADLTAKADQIGTYFRDKTGKGPTFIWTPERRRLVVDRLRENGGDVRELLYAVDGMVRDDFYNGRRTGKKQLRIELLCRDRDHIETLAELGGLNGRPHPFMVAND